TCLIPFRRFSNPDIASLSARMRAIVDHPAMATPIKQTGKAVPAQFIEAGSCQRWLVLRHKELSWIERTLATDGITDCVPAIDWWIGGVSRKSIRPLYGPNYPKAAPLVSGAQALFSFVMYVVAGLENLKRDHDGAGDVTP
ncbi:MAG: hypothetical protein ACOH2L_19160, partial [Devosia sp.]